MFASKSQKCSIFDILPFYRDQLFSDEEHAHFSSAKTLLIRKCTCCFENQVREVVSNCNSNVVEGNPLIPAVEYFLFEHFFLVTRIVYLPAKIYVLPTRTIFPPKNAVRPNG